jgi:hypothetical protein
VSYVTRGGIVIEDGDDVPEGELHILAPTVNDGPKIQYRFFLADHAMRQKAGTEFLKDLDTALGSAVNMLGMKCDYDALMKILNSIRQDVVNARRGVYHADDMPDFLAELTGKRH